LKRIVSHPAFKYLIIFLVFLSLTCFVRSSSFFKSVIDWDESVYLIMADHLIQGETPYTVIWDNKPPGIYYLFALSQLIFGKTIISIRIIACIAVALSSFLLYRIVINFSDKSTFLGWAAGLLYMTASLNNGGIAANTEIFFTPFVIYAFYLLFNLIHHKLTDQKFLCFIFIGFIIGIALQIKYVVIFDFFALLLIIIVALYHETNSDIKELTKRMCIIIGNLSLGILIPAIIVVIYFLGTGHFIEYFDANFVANFINTTNVDLSLSRFITSFYYQIFPNFFLWLIFFISIFFLSKDQKSGILVYFYIWITCVLCGLFVTKLFWIHYYLQLLPTLCLLSAFVFSQILREFDELKFQKLKRVIMILIISTPLFYSSFFEVRESVKIVYFKYVKNITYWTDTPAKIADYLKPRISENDYLYTADFQPILYYLLDVKIPTKYIFPPIIDDVNFSKIAGIDGVSELKSILAKKPLYITLRKDRPSKFYENLDDTIAEKYMLETTINNIDIFKRITHQIKINR